MSIVPDMLSHMGGVPVGMEVLQPADVKWLYSSTSAAPYVNLLANVSDATKLYSTLTAAEASLTSGRNDVIFVTPETHTLTAAVTWDNSNTHLIGMHSGSRWANNCKITHTSALSINNMITITGSDNIFQNLHIQHGVGSEAANLTAVAITGAGNLFENIWFEGPCDNSVANLGTGNLITLGGGGNVFRNCVFGSTSVPRTGAHAFVKFKAGCYRATFEDCIFYSQIDADAPRFFRAGSSGWTPSGPLFFRNCQFIAWSSAHDTKAALLFDHGTLGLSTAFWAFDQNCAAYGVTDICEASDEGCIYWAHNAMNYSTTGASSPDNMALGLAQNPNKS